MKFDLLTVSEYNELAKRADGDDAFTVDGNDDEPAKLAIDFDYDQDKMRRLKRTPFHDSSGPCTHRQWYGIYEWDDGDEGAWVVDADAGSFELVEQALQTKIPAEYKPSNRNGEVLFAIPDDYNWFFLKNPPLEVTEQLSSELAYEEPNAEYTDSYKKGTWDGWVRLYDRHKDGAPVGLLGRAVDIVEEMGYNTEIKWEGKQLGSQVDLEWNFPHDLRDYQKNAMSAALENDGGIISLPTGAGKTVTCMKLLHMMQRRSIVMVHTQELLYQWADEIRESLGVEPGIIGDGNWSEGPVTVAIMQTIMSRGADKLSNDYGVLVFDECHRTSAADNMHEIGMDINAYYRVGLSATPWRSVDGEELKIEGAIGGIVHQVTAEELIDEGFLARPEFDIVDPADFGSQYSPSNQEEYQTAYRNAIEYNTVRNEAIATKAAEMADDGYTVLVDVNRTAHGRILEYLLNTDVGASAVASEFDPNGDELEQAKLRKAQQTLNQLGRIADTNATFLQGSDDTERRQQVLDDFENGDTDILISTIVKEGVDLPAINGILFAGGGRSDIQLIQVIGRALRPSNGQHAKIVDVRDRGKFFGDQFDARQDALENYYGSYYTGPGEAIESEESTKPTEVTSLTDPMHPQEEAELMEDLGLVDDAEEELEERREEDDEDEEESEVKTAGDENIADIIEQELKDL